MPASPPGELTRLLSAWSGGDSKALEKLMPLVYDELREIARRYLRRERRGHTLQPTALVHEAYLKLVDQKRVRWQNRAQFFGVAAQLMRRILIDYARKRRTARRGGHALTVTLDDAVALSPGKQEDLIAIDDALRRLSDLDAQQARIVELRFFGGLTVAETAEVTGTSPAAVKREWTTAKAFLHHEMSAK